MSFLKNDKSIPSNAPISEKAKPFLTNKKRLNELDFQKEKDNSLEILKYCLKENVCLIQNLNISNAKDLYILKNWVEDDEANYLTCLDFGIDHAELLTQYIDKKLRRTYDYNIAEETTIIRSYDKKLILEQQYETKKGETISYFDKALGVPTDLVIKALLKLKLIDAQKLVKKIDRAIEEINLEIVIGYITSVLNTAIRDTVLQFITSKNISFYELPQHYTVLNKNILSNIHGEFSECGLEALNFSISDISIPNNTGDLLRNQFFAIAEAERVKAHEQKMESASLDLYERKAAIHNKYPNFPITLTEAEKDLALNRYLTRIGEDTTLKADIKNKSLARRELNNNGTITSKHKISILNNNKPNNFRALFALLVVALYLTSFIVFNVASISAGLIMFGVSTLIIGLVTFFCYNRIKANGEEGKIVSNDYTNNANASANQTVESPVKEVKNTNINALINDAKHDED